MLQEMIAEMEYIISKDYSNITGMVIMKNGSPVYEQYFNGYTEKNRIHVFSVTKSILSILIGIALDKGYIESVDQRILEFYPEYTVKRGEKTIQNITIKLQCVYSAYIVLEYIKWFVKRIMYIAY